MTMVGGPPGAFLRGGSWGGTGFAAVGVNHGGRCAACSGVGFVISGGRNTACALGRSLCFRVIIPSGGVAAGTTRFSPVRRA